jgi:hypothetical protein
MMKKERPLTVEIPRPVDDQPPWSRVGVIALIGFAVGVAWPKLTGVKIGPSVPGEGREAETAATAAPTAAAASPPPETVAPAPAAPNATASKNEQLVVIGSGTITRCSDKKNKKVEDCGALQFDPVALPKLKELAQCPSALGLEGKLAIGFEINFDKKEVQVVKARKVKTSLPTTTVNGILQCAAREFSTVALDEVPHKYPRYSLVYTATFYPPGKHPGDTGEQGKEAAKEGEAAEGEAAGTTTSESEASGSATISWDTALLRKEPKTGDVVARLVRGTKVKLTGKQNDWYKIEHRDKVGWVYRGAIGL